MTADTATDSMNYLRQKKRVQRRSERIRNDEETVQKKIRISHSTDENFLITDLPFEMLEYIVQFLKKGQIKRHWNLVCRKFYQASLDT